MVGLAFLAHKHTNSAIAIKIRSIPIFKEVRYINLKKGDKNSNGASTNGKTDQVGVVEQADEDPFNVLIAQ